jgi:hypothetical protein
MIEALRERIGDDVVARTLEAGFNLDFFDDGVLQQIGRVEKGTLALGPNRYQAVILPNVERIPLETLKKLEEFARGGGVVIATRRIPKVAPGFTATESERSQIREISRRLFEGPSAPAHFIEDENRQLGTKLAGLLKPDVSLSPAAPEIGFIHRSAEQAEIYFLANSSNMRHNAKATFRLRGENQMTRPEWWNPLTGEVSPAHVDERQPGGITVSLDLEPYGSRVLVLTNRTLPQRRVDHSSAVPSPIDLSAGWRVSFGQGARSIRMDTLRSWTEDEETRYFSGLAVYEKELVIPENLLQSGREVWLDFGESQPVATSRRRNGMRAWLEGPIREAAAVYINDVRAGSAWRPPYSVNVTGFLKRGENRIRIVVGNTAINHMAGRRLPDYRLLNLRYGVRFEPQDTENLQPIPSGLLGTVRLTAR